MYHVNCKKLAEILGKFFFWRVSDCAFCPHTNKFFFMDTNDIKVLRNKIWYNDDRFVLQKIATLALWAILAKKMMSNFTITVVEQQICNKCCPKFFWEFFIIISSSLYDIISFVPSQRIIQNIEVVAEITRWYDGDF